MPPRGPGAPGVCPQCGQPLRGSPVAACTSMMCVARRRAREVAEADERRRVARWETGRRHASAGPAGAEFAVLPGQRQPLVPPPEDAIRAFKAHLEHVAALAAAGAESDSEPALPTWAPETPWLDAACGACRGACCAEGRTNHAFLTVATLTELRRSGHPDGTLAPDALVADTLSRIPSEHVEGSCLFHGSTGCTLPRHRRGQMCNRYYCGPMKTADRRAVESGSDRLVVVGLTRTVSLGPGGGRVVAHATDGTDDELVAIGLASAAGFEPIAPAHAPSDAPERST